MKYRLLFSDIDGTLRPFASPQIPLPNVKAVQAVQRLGVKFVIATGRGRSSVPADMLNGLNPDYWICAAGAQVLDANGMPIASSRMELEQLEALTDFCAEGRYPLIFSFSDSAYAYVGYERFHQQELEQGLPPTIQNGEDRTRHLIEMPFSASAQIPEEAAARFQTRYSCLGLRFLYYNDSGCDILRPEQDKAMGLAMLLEHIGLHAEECVSVGDGNNDIEILQTAGLSFCVEDGVPGARAAADRICPASADYGVDAVCRTVWPEAF